MYIDVNLEISEVDHCTWIFTSRIFRLALETTFLLQKYFCYIWPTSCSHKVENLISGGVLIIVGKAGKLFENNEPGNA